MYTEKTIHLGNSLICIVYHSFKFNRNRMENRILIETI